LSGQVPKELIHLELTEFKVQSNNVTGIVPFRNCSNPSILEADCDSPQKVICECCTNCFGIFKTPTNIDECLEGVLEVVFNADLGREIHFDIYYSSNEAMVDEVSLQVKDVNSFFSFCMSMTDCLYIKFTNNYTPFHLSAAIDGTVFLDRDLNEGDKEIHFGYSSTEIMKENTCDAFQLCNSVYQNSTKRYLVNNLVKRTSYYKLAEDTSHEYNATCAFVKFFDVQTIYKSELLQHYFLSLLYFATMEIIGKRMLYGFQINLFVCGMESMYVCKIPHYLHFYNQRHLQIKKEQ